MADTLVFELVSPQKLQLSEEVQSVLVPGSEGDFMVLPLHAPVLSTMRPGLLDIVLADGTDKAYFVRGGIAEMSEGGLTVLVQEAIDMAELDRDWLAQQIQNAQEDVTDAKDEDTRTAAQNTLDQLKAVQTVAGGA